MCDGPSLVEFPQVLHILGGILCTKENLYCVLVKVDQKASIYHYPHNSTLSFALSWYIDLQAVAMTTMFLSNPKNAPLQCLSSLFSLL